MTGWTADELDRLGTARELRIAGLRADGTLRDPVSITAHQLGSCLGLAALTTAATAASTTAGEFRIALTGSAAALAVALVLSIVLIAASARR